MSTSDQLQPSIFFRAFDIAFFVPGMILFLSVLFSYSEYTTTIATMSQVVSEGSQSANDSMFDRFLSMNETQLSTIAIVQIVMLVLGCYVCGLVCHSVSWCSMNRVVEWLSNRKPSGAFRQHFCRIAQFLVGLRSKDCVAFHDKTTNNKNEDVGDDELSESEQESLVAESLEASQNQNIIGSGEASQFPADKVWTTDVLHYTRRVDYFWYLRGTCWNASFALLVGGTLLLFSRWSSERAQSLGAQTWGDGLWRLHEIPSTYLWGVGIVTVCSFFLLRIGTRFGASCESRKELCKHVCTQHSH